MADGSINFDTKVDESGVEKFSDTLKKNIAEIEKEIDRFNKRIENKEFQLVGNNSEKSVQKISAQLDALEAKRDELLSEKANQEEALRIQIDKEGAEEKLLKTLEAFENFRSTIANGVVNVTKTVIGGIGNAFKGVGTIVSKVAKTAGGAIKGIVTKLSEWRKRNLSVTASAKAVVGQFMRLSNVLKGKVLRAFAQQISNAVSEGMQSLARFSPNFNKAISSMQSSLATLGGNFVSAFAPIVEFVAPVINTLVGYLNTAVQALGNFFSALTGKGVVTKAVKVQKDYAKSLDSTGKSAERQLASFDEINKLNNSASGGGSGSDVSYENVETKASELAELFKNGEFVEAGTYLAEMINSQIDNIKWDEIGTKIGNGLQHAIEFAFGFISNINTESIGSGIGELINNGMYAIDFNMLGNTLSQLFNRIIDLSIGFTSSFDFSEFGLSIAEGISGAINNFDIVGFIDGLDGWIVGIWDALIALLTNIDYAGFFKKIGEGLAEMVLNISEWELWTLIGDYFEEKADECGGSLILGILKGIVDALVGIGQWIWDNIFVPIYDGICEVFGIHSPSTVMAGVGENLIEGMLQGISDTWHTITDFFSNNFPVMYEFITKWIDTIIESCKGILNGIVKFVTGVFSGNWSQAWEGIKDIFKNVWNGIVGFAESAVNFVVDCLNTLSFDVPSWVPFIGGSHFGFNISRISIPRLATGTVVPANSGEFLSILGDNNREAEVVSPLSTMKEALTEALADYGQQNVNIKFDGSLSELARILRPVIEKEDKRVGKTLVSSGA